MYQFTFIMQCQLVSMQIAAKNHVFFHKKKRNLVAREIDAHGVLVFRSGGNRFTFGMVELRNRTLMRAVIRREMVVMMGMSWEKMGM